MFLHPDFFGIWTDISDFRSEQVSDKIGKISEFQSENATKPKASHATEWNHTTVAH
jgi:hypothetical protein